LSEIDSQAGFTAGRVVAVDLRASNSGRSQVDALDTQVDWLSDLEGGGKLRLTAAATWQPNFRTQRSPQEAVFNRVGHVDGPLRKRGNIGAEWSRASTTLGLNLQYYAAYRVTYSDPARANLNPQIIRDQGAARIPSQAYVDLHASRQLPIGKRQVEFALNVANVLDSRPPILARPDTPGYSFYGDPRRRRFELALTSRF
jgi:hypothetical protein